MAEGDANMKKGLHPETKKVTFKCVCGNEFEAVSTLKAESFTVDTCNACHPFYTGKQNFGGRKGQVEKFNKKYGFDKEAK